MQKFDVSKKPPIFTFLKTHNEVRIKKVERFDVYKKLRYFHVIERSSD